VAETAIMKWLAWLAFIGFAIGIGRYLNSRQRKHPMQASSERDTASAQIHSPSHTTDNQYLP
jgi:hypothetical protein